MDKTIAMSINTGREPTGMQARPAMRPEKSIFQTTRLGRAHMCQTETGPPDAGVGMMARSDGIAASGARDRRVENT